MLKFLISVEANTGFCLLLSAIVLLFLVSEFFSVSLPVIGGWVRVPLSSEVQDYAAGESVFSASTLFSVVLGVSLLAVAFRSFFRQVREQGLSSAFRVSVQPHSSPRNPRMYRLSRAVRRRQTVVERMDATPMRSEAMPSRLEGMHQAAKQLPVHEFRTPEELLAMSADSLRQKAQEMRVNIRGMDKQEVAARLVDVGGTSGNTCSICCEDYESGDKFRLLSCGHRFHVDCVDTWFATESSHAKLPTCPNCTLPLKMDTVMHSTLRPKGRLLLAA